MMIFALQYWRTDRRTKTHTKQKGNMISIASRIMDILKPQCLGYFCHLVPFMPSQGTMLVNEIM